MTAPIRVAVVGTGALGKEHARIYAEMSRQGAVQCVGIYDRATETMRSVAGKLGVPTFETMDDLVRAAEAVSVVTPTPTHYELASQLLSAGKHVLVEKPITQEPSQAAGLVELARSRGLILQVGHVERFNPVFQYLQEITVSPRFIETHRLSPYPGRSIDIGVVLDLMIHDLDVVLAFVRSPVVDIDAVGIPVLSQSEDLANARLRFQNGCVANLTASRVSPERMRKIRVFSAGPTPSYVSLDYRAQEGFIYRIAREHEKESSLWQKLLATKDATVVSAFGGKRVVREPVPIKKEEPLRLELENFVDCVRARRDPVVSGEAGQRALELAMEITRRIRQGPDFAPAVAAT